MIIAVDTQVLVYAIEDAKKPECVDVHRRARFFLEETEREGNKIMVPSVSIGEFLAIYEDSDKKEEVLETLRQFMIVPFDAKAANIYGEIYHEKVRPAVEEKDERSKRFKKRKLCVDCQVVASAVCWGADIVVSNDKDIKRLGKDRILVSEIPAIPEQLKLKMAEPL